MAPTRRLILLLLFFACIITDSLAQSEPAKDKKQGRKMSDVGPSFMRKRTHPMIFYRPRQPTTILALLFLS
ncbi:unnamed protein product [Caenorhabditis bovis]|uniref:Uncharacterized protein n=1 Tax=Caenorhabditis bovis TaxID=2654633 RepID=A0A8S1EYS3_9PELO|nr:unnamed protein product [Caenorhabditis bovis]